MLEAGNRLERLLLRLLTLMLVLTDALTPSSSALMPT
jgi:hypothetical protein